jgi:elongation factor P
MKAKDLRKGTFIVHNGDPYRVMEAHHSTPGNLRGRVQSKLRNLINGSQTELRFGSTEEVEEADVFHFKATYLYREGPNFNFMNSENYEQVAISEEVLGEAIFFLQDGMEVEVFSYNGNPIGVNLPPTVILEIVETEPELRGATASNSPKPATTQTGLTLSVPPFVKIGDRIVVNTSENKYISRAEEGS